MIDIRVMIANGRDTMVFRDQAVEVILQINHLFLHELEAGLAVTNWDFRRDSPTVVPKGSMAARSLSKVDASEVVLVIFGTRVPKITRKEMWRAFKRREAGESVEVWTFVDPRKISEDHLQYFAKIEKEFDEEVVWSEYKKKLDFQAIMYTTMFKYLTVRCGAQFPGTAA